MNVSANVSMTVSSQEGKFEEPSTKELLVTDRPIDVAVSTNGETNHKHHHHLHSRLEKNIRNQRRDQEWRVAGGGCMYMCIFVCVCVCFHVDECGVCVL